MSYNSGIINSSTPAATVMATIQPVINAHPAWEFVETVGGSVATNVTDVYRCLGTANNFGTDFYVGICRSGATPGTQAMGFILGETYNSGAKVFGKGAVHCSPGTTLTSTANFSYATDRHVANETTMVAATDGFLRAVANKGSTVAGIAPGTADVAFTYYLSVTNDRIVFFTSTQNIYVYVGLYDSFHSTALDPFPLVCIALTASADGTRDVALSNPYQIGAATREAAQVGVITGAFRTGLSGHPWTWHMGSQANRWFFNAPNKEPISGKWWPSRMVLYPEARAGGIKGLLKPDVLVMTMFEVNETVGDTIAIDGVTYTCLPGSYLVYEMNSSGGNDQHTNSIWVSQAA